MLEDDSQNLAFHWSTLFVRALFEAGVRNVIISPGSRSTALTLAFSAHPGFEKYTSIDERSAGFMALGQAKTTSTPTALVCTSGTALANYTPAVYEASNSGIPMLILSADRPPSLRSIGAPQTIDQIKIFGNQPVFFHEVGLPNSSLDAQERLKALAQQSVDKTLHHKGVAHLNFAFDKPFEPEDEFLSQVAKENENHAKRSQTDYDQQTGKVELGEKFWSELIASERPLIIVGENNRTSPFEFITPLSRILNAPVISEPGSNISSSRQLVSGFSGFLRNKENRDELKPDLILRFGGFPVSKGVQLLLQENQDVHQISFSNPDFPNHGNTPANRSIHLNHELEIPDIDGNADPKWIKKWRKTSKEFQKHLRAEVYPKTPLTDGFLFKEASNLIPKKSFVMLSNSFPVRDFSLFTDHTGKEVYVNRGAAGIDGIISTTIGISSQTNKSGVLFVGDIAFLHDVNALLHSKYASESLIIVVLNNGGGTIFRMLPVYKFKEKHKQYFETPQGTKIVSLCRGFNVDHELVSKPEQFAKAFEKFADKPGVHVIECITDADDSMMERHSLWNFKMDS